MIDLTPAGIIQIARDRGLVLRASASGKLLVSGDVKNGMTGPLKAAIEILKPDILAALEERTAARKPVGLAKFDHECEEIVRDVYALRMGFKFKGGQLVLANALGVPVPESLMARLKGARERLFRHFARMNSGHHVTIQYRIERGKGDGDYWAYTYDCDPAAPFDLFAYDCAAATDGWRFLADPDDTWRAPWGYWILDRHKYRFVKWGW